MATLPFERTDAAADPTPPEASAPTLARRLAQLQELTSELATALTVPEVVDRFLSLSRRLFGAAAGVVYLADGAGDFQLYGTHGVPTYPTAFKVLRADAPLPIASALRHRVPVWVETYDRLIARYPNLASAETPVSRLQAVAALPLVHGAEVVGAIGLTFDRPHAFDADERDWLTRFAGQLAVAAARAQSYAAEQEARREAETLRRVAESLNATGLDLDAVVQQVTDEATRAVGANFGAFFYNVTDANGESYQLYTLSGAPKDAFSSIGLPRNTPLFSKTFTGERIVRVADIKQDPLYGKMGPHHGMPKGHLPVTSYLAVPVISRAGEVIGGLFFAHREADRFTAAHERLVAAIASTAASAIDNARLYQSAREAEDMHRRLVAELTETVRVNETVAGVLAHDLRNPLNAILAAAQLGLARAGEGPLEKPLSRIVASGQRMARMIEQLLDLARIRIGELMPLDPKPCDMAPLVHHVIDELDGAAAARAVQLETVGDTKGCWDGDRLSQVLSNLIGNALQHREQGPVRVAIDAAREREVRIAVHNDGAIPPELLPKLFEPLTAGEKRRDRSSGLGLGLFITQQIARAHGGRVEVESDAATGTTFTVTLPRFVEAGPRPRPSAAPRPLQEAKERAWQSEQRMRLLVDSIRDCAIYMLDIDGRVATWNLGAERLKGFKLAEVVGKHFSMFLPREDVEAGRAEEELKLARESGMYETEGWRVRKDGSRFWANVMIGAVHDTGGQLVGYYKVTRDLTERRRAEQEVRESENRLRMIVDGVKDYAIYMLDALGNVQTWSPGAEAAKGYRREEIVGQHFSIFFTPEARAAGRPQQLLARAAIDGRVEDQAWRVRKDGSQFWADVVITALRDTDGTLLGYAKVVRDLTERRRAAEQRARLAQAEEAIRLRDEFLSLVSHELKTPLAGLQMQLEVLQQGVDASDNKVQQKLKRATMSSDRLADLIESLLDVSRVATGRFSLAPADLDFSQVVTDVVDGLRLAAGKAHCELLLQIDGPVRGRWDRVRVEQVVTNLLSNALKYGAGRPVVVAVRGTGYGVELEVRDHGPGLNESEMPRLFERFERAASTRHYGGLGIGLYLVREIVAAHGGAVAATNAPGGGASFTVRLPLQPPTVGEGLGHERELQ